MSRKHYEMLATALARAIRNQPDDASRDAAWETCNEVADVLQANSSRFNRSRFIGWVEARAL